MAFGLSIAVFIFWGILGYATLAVLKIRRSSVQNMLLSPVVGVSVTLLPVFWLNLAGFPIIQFGVSLTIILLLISMGILWRLQPIIPWKQFWPFAVVLLLALFLTGRPMLEFGFNWLSYCNGDFAYYILDGTRMLNHGFFNVNDLDQLVKGKDYSFIFWFISLVSRSGPQMLVAWLSSLTGLMADKIFMPLIMALHVTLISSIGALVYQTRRLRAAAIMTCILVGFSALTSLGALYQLFGQVAGLSLLIGSMTILFRPLANYRIISKVRDGILAALLISALFVMYPEILPFLGLVFISYFALAFIRRRLIFRPVIILLGVTTLLTIVMLNSYGLTSLAFLQKQTTSGLSSTNVQTAVFSYYLIPSGLANLWGFQSISSLLSEPLQTITILGGAILLLITILAAGLQSWNLKPAAVMVLLMLALSVSLFIQRSDFALFKLSMFIQPFLLATVVLAWFELIKRRIIWQIIPLLLLAFSGLTVQTFYVEQSRGVTGAFIAVPKASSSQINDEFDNLIKTTNPKVVVLDAPNYILAQFQTLYLRGRISSFPGQFLTVANAKLIYKLGNPDLSLVATSLEHALQKRYVNASFQLRDNLANGSNNEFIIDTLQPPFISTKDVFLIATTPLQNLLNRTQFHLVKDRNFVAIPWAQVQNHLIFISSKQGLPYNSMDNRHNIGLYQIEHDPYFREETMVGVGRDMLFQVVNPSKGARLVLDMTATLKGDGENRLPPAVAIGKNRHFFPIVGRGSARVFSPPLDPKIIEGFSYLGVDMGIDPTQFPHQKIGLMNLYGTDVPVDSRFLVGFARNISLVSEEYYTHLSPPSKVENFPTDLENLNLEYSGVYEDGWISDAAFFRLTQPNATEPLVIRGMVPEINNKLFSTEIIILVDGQEIAKKSLGVGDFNIEEMVPNGSQQRKVEIRFSVLQKLPGADKRQVAALINFIGFGK